MVVFRSFIGLVAALLVAVSMLCGCRGGDDYAPALERAEALLDSMPDTSMAIIRAIPRDEIASRRVRALRDLLEAEAEYKCYIENPEDSLLAEAVGYFRYSGDEPLLMRALYQQSLKEYYRADYTASIVTGLEALDYAEALENTEYLAKINELIGDIYACNYNFKESLHRKSIAAYNYLAIGKTRNVQFAKIDCAKNLYNLGLYDNAISVIDSVLFEAENGDTVLLSYAYETKIRPCIKLDLLDEAKYCEGKMRALNNDKVPFNQILSAVLSIREHDFTKARNLIDKISSGESEQNVQDVDLLYLEYNYHIACGDSARATSYYNRMSEIENDSLWRVLNNQIVSYEKEHSLEKVKESGANIKASKNLTYLLLAIGVVLALAFVIFYKNRERSIGRIIKEKDISIADLYEQLKSRDLMLFDVSRSLSRQESLTVEANNRIKELFREQFDVLNSLCKDYFEKKNATEKIRLTLLNDIESTIKSICNKGKLKNIEDILNTYYDGIVKKLDEALPGLNVADKKILLLSMTNISTKAICIICNLTDTAYYNKRQFLRTKLSLSGSKHKDILLKFLSAKGKTA